MDVVTLKNDRMLRHRILQLLEENGIKVMYGLKPNEIADSFIEYSHEQRQEIINWYENLGKTKTNLNFIEKTGFEEAHFYISGTDALVAMMLLGFCVNDHRMANVSARDMRRLNRGKGK